MPPRPQGMEQYWDGRSASISPPLCKRSGSDSQILPTGDRKHWVRYLSNFPYIFILVHTESLYRHSFIVVNAFPDITGTPRGDWIISRLDEIFGYNVGSREQSRSATELAELLEYLYIVVGAVRACFMKGRSESIHGTARVRVHLVKHLQQNLRPFLIRYQEGKAQVV